MKKLLLLLSCLLLAMGMAAGCDNTTDDANNTPALSDGSHFGYLAIDENGNLLLNEAEWITEDQTDRIEELQLQDKMPDGYFIYDEEPSLCPLTLSPDITYTFYDYDRQFVTGDTDYAYTTENADEFLAYYADMAYQPDWYEEPFDPYHWAPYEPFWVEVKDGQVTSITLQLVL